MAYKGYVFRGSSGINALLEGEINAIRTEYNMVGHNGPGWMSVRD